MSVDHSAKYGLADPISERLGYRLRRASTAMMNDLGARMAVAIGLRPVEGAILVLVGSNAGATQSDIGRLLGIKRANMVPLIIALTSKGLIEREPTDGRSYSLSLTAVGEAARVQVDALMDANEQQLSGALSAHDKGKLYDALDHIQRHFGENLHRE